MPKKKIEPDFFAVNRSLLNSDRWLAEPFTRGQAWVDLFGLAQYRDGEFRVRGIVIDVKRGQLAYSQLTLASRWKWSRNKVRRYLKELEKRKDIEQQNTEVTTVITILRYDHWQGGCDASDVVNDTTSDTTEGQQKDNRKTTEGTHNKKDKKENKDKKNTKSSSEPEKVPVTKQVMFDYDTGTFTGISEKILQLWYKAYPAVDVDNAIDRAGLWLMANPNKRKKNYFRFLTNWMSKGQERGGSVKSERLDEAEKKRVYDNMMEKYGT